MLLIFRLSPHQTCFPSEFLFLLTKVVTKFFPGAILFRIADSRIANRDAALRKCPQLSTEIGRTQNIKREASLVRRHIFGSTDAGSVSFFQSKILQFGLEVI